MSSKLNRLLSETTPGELVLQLWLTERGISPALARKYVIGGWLTKLGAGVYYRPGREPRWQDALYCLIRQLGMPVHLAGLSSLAQQGRAHYLQLSEHRVWLGAAERVFLPKWFREFPGVEWQLVSAGKLGALEPGELRTLESAGRELPVSGMELAAYELVLGFPRLIGFDHLAELFQGLVNLSPRKVQSLLGRSCSVRANRLFLFLSHYQQLPWLERIDESGIHLGSGKRQMVLGGKLDARYQITVPEAYVLGRRFHG